MADTYQAPLNVLQNYFPKSSELAKKDRTYRFGMAKAVPDYDSLDARSRQIANNRVRGQNIGASREDVESYLSHIHYQGRPEDDKRLFNFLIGRGVGTEEMARMFDVSESDIKNRYTEVLGGEAEDNPFLFMQAVDDTGNPFDPSNVTKKQGVYYVDMPNVSLGASDDSQNSEQVAAQNAADKARFEASKAEQQAKAQAQAKQIYIQMQADQEAEAAQQMQQGQQIGQLQNMQPQGLINQIVSDTPFQTYGTTQKYLGQDLNNIQLSNVKNYLGSLDDGSYLSLARRILGF